MRKNAPQVPIRIQSEETAHEIPKADIKKTASELPQKKKAPPPPPPTVSPLARFSLRHRDNFPFVVEKSGETGFLRAVTKRADARLRLARQHAETSRRAAPWHYGTNGHAGSDQS